MAQKNYHKKKGKDQIYNEVLDWISDLSLRYCKNKKGYVLRQEVFNDLSELYSKVQIEADKLLGRM